MIGAALQRELAARADAVAAEAVAAVAVRIVTRAEAVSGLAAEAAADAIVLRGRGLLARAFGTRRRSADPRITGLALGDDS
jgi:hypothetical protein